MIPLVKDIFQISAEGSQLVFRNLPMFMVWCLSGPKSRAKGLCAGGSDTKRLATAAAATATTASKTGTPATAARVGYSGLADLIKGFDILKQNFVLPAPHFIHALKTARAGLGSASQEPMAQIISSASNTIPFVLIWHFQNTR